MVVLPEVKLLADSADLQWTQRGRYSHHAAMAENLLKLLREPLGAGLPPPIPVSDDFLQQLEHVARRLRLAEPENAPSGMKVSPLDRRDSSRVRVAFMSLMSADLLALCGRRLDEEVRLLTEIAFPGQEITIAMVRSARTTRKRRPPRQ